MFRLSCRSHRSVSTNHLRSTCSSAGPNADPPKEEILVDRPEIDDRVTRVSGPFVVEATIPTPAGWGEIGSETEAAALADNYGTFVDRIIEVLRHSPVLRIDGN